jgi:hypothetical protein
MLSIIIPLPDAIFKYMSQNIPKSKGKTFYFDYGDQGLDKHYSQYSKKGRFYFY